MGETVVCCLGLDTLTPLHSEEGNGPYFVYGNPVFNKYYKMKIGGAFLMC